MNTQDQDLNSDNLQKAQAALLDTIGRFSKQSSQENRLLKSELVDLLGMSHKLETGRVDIVIFGEVNTGKSALMNALIGKAVASTQPIAGWTTEVSQNKWDALEYKVDGFADSHVYLLDTPGLNEVSGAEHAALAQNAAQKADLVIFVTDSDLNDAEFSALNELAKQNKPIILAFNKIDILSKKDKAVLIDKLTERTVNIVDPINIIAVAADPQDKLVIRQLPDGSETEEIIKPAPIILDLKIRILEILKAEGKELIALNAALFAADRNDKIVATIVKMKDEQANNTITRFAIIKGIAVAVNPIPIVDVVGGFLIDARMVEALAGIYSLKMSDHQAEELRAALAGAARLIAAANIVTSIAAGLLAVPTLGLSILVSALPQGVTAAYGSYIVGQVAKRYLKNGAGWADKEPKRVVEEIIKQAQKDSVLNMLKDRIMAEINANPHAIQP